MQWEGHGSDGALHFTGKVNWSHKRTLSVRFAPQTIRSRATGCGHMVHMS